VEHSLLKVTVSLKLCSKGLFLFIFFRKEEQIKKDEQLARALQEQLERDTPPETRCNELTSQTLVSGDQQGNEQIRRGQV